MNTTEQKQLNELLERARKCKNKGRLYVYEQYKNELQYMNLSSEEFTSACRQLCEYLRV